MNRILVIRGGAIGDFILTLPALKALRDAHPRAYIEILGYKHIAVLAETRFYAQAVRSIEYGPLSRFFAKDPELPADLANYFACFDLIISYLHDPDRIFENNLRRCNGENLIRGPAKIDDSRRISFANCRALFLPSIPEAAVIERTGRWKIGSISSPICLNPQIFKDRSSSFPAKPTKIEFASLN